MHHEVTSTMKHRGMYHAAIKILPLAALYPLEFELQASKLQRIVLLACRQSGNRRSLSIFRPYPRLLRSAIDHMTFVLRFLIFSPPRHYFDAMIFRTNTHLIPA
jgi:hypothetical protein